MSKTNSVQPQTMIGVKPNDMLYTSTQRPTQTTQEATHDCTIRPRQCGCGRKCSGNERHSGDSGCDGLRSKSSSQYLRRFWLSGGNHSIDCGRYWFDIGGCYADTCTDRAGGIYPYSRLWGCCTILRIGGQFHWSGKSQLNTRYRLFKGR